MSATGSPFEHVPSHFPHMRQYEGPMWSRWAVRIFSSASVNFEPIAFRLASSCSMSVMLGTVVSILGFFRTHLRAATMAPSRCRMP